MYKYIFEPKGEEEWMKEQMKEKEDFKFSFLNIADMVGITPDKTLCL